ncbi:MAG: chemotaxis protein CheX [Deltaproteobacteria bacterium]|nr:chemotaxis protein CheX [Deltaproteobacteria bacterium]
MITINRFDVKTFLTKAVKDVFDTMLSMGVEPHDPDGGGGTDGYRIMASVGVVGEVTGVIAIQMGYGFAKEVTASMLGMEPDEIESTEEVSDVIGELANMIGGSLKSRLCDFNLSCQLSIPSITHGSNFKVTSMKGAQHERFCFHHALNIICVDIYMKAKGDGI